MEVKKKMLTDQGAIVVSAKHVYNMVIGRDRRPELGYAILGMAPWSRPEWIFKHNLICNQVLDSYYGTLQHFLFFLEILII